MKIANSFSVAGLFASVGFAMAQNSSLSFSFFRDIPLSSSMYLAPAVTPYSFATGDFNGDGLVDIVAASPRETILFINRANGVFESNPSGSSRKWSLQPMSTETINWI